MSSNVVMIIALVCVLGGAAAGWFARGAQEPATDTQAPVSEDAGVSGSEATTLGTKQ